MELKLNPDQITYFEERMKELVPWIHTFKFSEEILTGYFKTEDGLGRAQTYVNSHSNQEDVAKMRNAYEAIDHTIHRNFFTKIMQHIAPLDRKNACLLDIASATGKLSMYAVDDGFGKVISSEIRKNQCNQQRLIYDCLENQIYNQTITLINDPTSADADNFSENYKEFDIDIVLSFGLLYHLVNPLQHLINLRNLTNKYAVIYTLTHFSPFAKRMWHLRMEDSTWITKATSSVSWIPHFIEVKRLCKQVGFKEVKIVYPDVFEKKFSDFEDYSVMTDAKLMFQLMLKKLTGVGLGMVGSQNPFFFHHTGMNPNYFAYVLEL